jgi:hypothetical protein
VRRELLITTVASIAGVIFCGAARAADPATAADDQRPNAALAACASGDVAKGISILGQLYAETRSPAYVFNQGRCYQKNNQLEQARSSFAEYLRIGTSEPPEDLQRAQAFVKEIDDELASQRARQATSAPAPAPVVVVVAPPAGEGRRHSLRVTSIVLASIGVAAIATGAYLSLKVRQANNDINQEFAGMDYVTDGAHLQQQLSDGERYETWQWVGYGLGVAALAGAVTTFILSGGIAGGSASSEHVALDVAPALSPDGVGGVLRMRF